MKTLLRLLSTIALAAVLLVVTIALAAMESLLGAISGACQEACRSGLASWKIWRGAFRDIWAQPNPAKEGSELP